MFGFLKNATSGARRLFGHVGNVVRQWGTTATNVARTLDGHKGHVKSLVSEIGHHFNADHVANAVNSGIDQVPSTLHNIGTKLKHIGKAVHPSPF